MRFVRILIFVFLSSHFFTGIVFAENLFTFSTEPQNIDLNILSGPITIHADASVSETTYIALSSNSASGQFFSSKTSVEPISLGSYVYISTNNQNRTVYYKDSTVGNFVITANVFAKDKTTQLASITQNISIGTIQSNNTATTTATSTDDVINTSISTSSNISAHSSPAPLSTTENKIELEISAGRDRLSTIGNNLVFIATATKAQNLSESGITYYWSFGDGTTAQGKNVTHTYKFAGEYSVVLNATYSDKQAVSRVQVNVISPNLSMIKIPEGVEIQNNSNSEINLDGWKLITPNKIFVFPQDTLIPSGKKVIFADSVTGIYGSDLVLTNPVGKEFVVIQKTNVSINPEEITQKIKDINRKIVELSNVENTDPVVIVKQDFIEPEVPEVVEKENIDQVASAITVFEAEKDTGLVSRIFAWPIKGFNFVRRLFVEQ